MVKHGMLLLAFSILNLVSAAPEKENIEPLKVISSAKPVSEEWGPSKNAADKNWRTVFSTHEKNADGTRAPHPVMIDLGEVKTVHGFVYIPDGYRNEGRIKDYRFYVTSDTNISGTPVQTGTFNYYESSFWPEDREKFETIMLGTPVKGRYVTLVSLSDHKNSGETSVAEFEPITDPDRYTYKNMTFSYLKGHRMAPSIHLGYSVPNESKLFYLEMKAVKSVPGSYFMSIGFGGGYFGIQEQSNGKKVILFSVWDSAKTDNPNDVPEDQRVKVLYQDKEMLVRRFGGEGVGVQSFLNFKWNLNENYRFAVKIDHTKDSQLAVYTAWFFNPDDNKWRKLVSLRRPNYKGNLNGFHSFVEDFRRNFESFEQTRTAEFSNMWSLGLDGKWVPVTKGRFTVDSNPCRNIDAGPILGGGFLSTGGNIKNETTQVYTSFPIAPRGNPPDLPAEMINDQSNF